MSSVIYFLVYTRLSKLQGLERLGACESNFAGPSRSASNDGRLGWLAAIGRGKDAFGILELASAPRRRRHTVLDDWQINSNLSNRAELAQNAKVGGMRRRWAQCGFSSSRGGKMDGSEMGQTKKKSMAAMTFPPTKFAHHPRVDDEGREEKQGRENVAICDRRPWQHMRFTREDRNPLPTSAMSLDGEGEVSCYRRRFQVHHRQPSGFQLAGCYPLAAHHCRSLTAPSALFPRVSWQATPACGLLALVAARLREMTAVEAMRCASALSTRRLLGWIGRQQPVCGDARLSCRGLSV